MTDPTSSPTSSPASSPEPTPAPEVDVTEAARRAHGDDVVLLDVREDDEWAQGHAPTAQHMALGDLRPQDLPTGATVLTICRSGRRSAKAAQALAQAGLQVANVSGGMLAWAEQDLPVEASDGSVGSVK